MRPKFQDRFAPFNLRAQGMPDARWTRDLVSNVHKKVRPRAYRAAENIRHSLRNGFTAYSELSPENGSFASVAPFPGAAVGLICRTKRHCERKRSNP